MWIREVSTSLTMGHSEKAMVNVFDILMLNLWNIFTKFNRNMVDVISRKLP